MNSEENELLSRVGPRTLMGDLLRQYWMPALLSREVEPDGPPLRIRLLGEDLLAFRDTSGSVGLLAENCSHRGASLFFGRNEECGLRCVYHGWKYDVSGQCVDMPNEPPETSFAEKIRHPAYPCRERGDVIWAYMGPGDPPNLPDFDWALVPSNQRLISYRWESCNWVQALDGGIDSSHISFLHRRLGDIRGENSDRTILFRARDTHPRFEVQDTDYGVVIAARRDAEDEQYYWRISQFLMPFHQMIPPTGGEGHGGHAWVPVDDQNTITWTMAVHSSRTPEEQERALHNPMATHAAPEQLLPPTSAPYGAWRPALTRENDYLLDRQGEKTERFCSVAGVWAQDQAVQESMGPIYDRTKEHLGSADLAITHIRHRLIQAALALRKRDETPPGARNGAAYQVRSASIVLPRDVPWIEGTRDHLVAHV